jgi:hypothetical protein
MGDLENLELMQWRGKYSTIRQQHENAKKELHRLCDAAIPNLPKILKHMQPDFGVPGMPNAYLNTANCSLDSISHQCQLIVELATLRAELKPKAWPK